MPIYEYRCADCGHELEKIQKLADAPLTECPACGHATLKKQISAAGFRLKGSGWYETDFKQGEKKKNLHGDGGDGGKSESGASASKSESAKSADSAAKPAATSGESSAKPVEKKPAPKADAA